MTKFACPHKCEWSWQRGACLALDVVMLSLAIYEQRAAWAAWWSFCLVTNLDILLSHLGQSPGPLPSSSPATRP